MFTVGVTGYRVYKKNLYYLYNFLENLKLPIFLKFINFEREEYNKLGNVDARINS